MKTINISKFANVLQAFKSCEKAGNTEWEEKHHAYLLGEVEKLPSGSGINAGITLNFVDSSRDKLIFNFGYHHMNQNGYYIGWTKHQLIIKPSLIFGIDLKITGKNRNGVKEYLHDLFSDYFFIK